MRMWLDELTRELRVFTGGNVVNGVESHVPSFDERREIKGEPKEKIFLLEDGYARNCHVPRVRINLRSRSTRP